MYYKIHRKYTQSLDIFFFNQLLNNHTDNRKLFYFYCESNNIKTG